MSNSFSFFWLLFVLFCIIFKLIFLSISSISVWFIENFNSWFFQVCLLLVWSWAYDLGHKFQRLAQVDFGFSSYFLKLFF
jgi:hypothetical protein